MVRTLLLVRHGETEWNKDGRFQGQRDIPLSELGRAQARALRARLDVAEHAHLFDPEHTAVVSSDLRRAHETAEIAFGVAGRTLHVLRDLREFHYGVFEGLTRGEIDERFPGVLAAWVHGDRSRAIDGGESRAAVHARAHAAVKEFLTAVSHPSVVIVGHGGVMRQLLGACFEGRDEPWTLSMANTVAHMVRVEQSSWTYLAQL
jgi:glucosyl-3-phosphoglycerate phosphatase